MTKTSVNIMKTIQEKIEVMQAFADGKDIEVYISMNGDTWVPRDQPLWNWKHCDYRIAEKKPVLVPHWPAIYSIGGTPRISDELFASLDAAVIEYRDYGVTRLATEYPPIMLEMES